MKIYLVGGAVRDKLLGLPVKEKDWVVVGATVAEMLKLGFKQVGKEFPVFLHPKTGEEYALARMERKVKPGYKGFTFDTSPHVSLEEDLIRRDLTINAMAESEDGQLIDPYNGKQDLDRKLLRHVSSAFAEDPVRILRTGRFLARYAHLGFHVAPETIQLMWHMTTTGEVDALVAERVWKELERALGEKNPEKFFELLNECAALPILFPGLDSKGEGMQALVTTTRLTTDPATRLAALLHALPEADAAITAFCNRYRFPTAFQQLAKLTALQSENALRAKKLSAAELLKLFSTLDIYRREDRFKQFLVACQAIANARQQEFDSDWLLAAAHAAKSYDVQELVKQGLDGQELAVKLKEKRLETIDEWLRRK